MAAKKRTIANRSGGGRRPGQGAKGGKGGKGGKGYRGLPPRGSQQITLEEAVDLTQRFRRSAPPAPHGGFFWVEGIKALLEQGVDVAGIRFYHGLTHDGEYQMVLVAVDSEGRDIVKLGRGKGTRAPRATGSAVLLDNNWRCPPWCDPTSPLL